MGFTVEEVQLFREVTNRLPNRSGMERPAREGDSPVDERYDGFLSGLPSTAGHVESRGNPGGPSPKAKYSPVTDSALVP